MLAASRGPLSYAVTRVALETDQLPSTGLVAQVEVTTSFGHCTTTATPHHA